LGAKVTGKETEAMNENETETQITRAEFEEVARQVREIHEMLSGFRNGVEAMMNNPMLSAMLPPQVRGLL